MKRIFLSFVITFRLCLFDVSVCMEEKLAAPQIIEKIYATIATNYLKEPELFASKQKEIICSIKQLLENSVNVDQFYDLPKQYRFSRDLSKITLLTASVHGLPEVVTYLVDEAGADINLPVLGIYPLHYAFLGAYDSKVRHNLIICRSIIFFLLSKESINVNIKEPYEYVTPLHLACHHFLYRDVVKKLIEKGACVRVKSKSGLYPDLPTGSLELIKKMRKIHIGALKVKHSGSGDLRNKDKQVLRTGLDIIETEGHDTVKVELDLDEESMEFEMLDDEKNEAGKADLFEIRRGENGMVDLLKFILTPK
jgi:hypothetical protein